MDDSTASTASTKKNANTRIPLGMESFDANEREQFGRNIRLALACIEGSAKPDKAKAIPDNEITIRQRLKALSQEITSQHADLLELLVRFDELKGWEPGGASHCAAWMNVEIGISLKLGWEYLNVGRKLRALPTIKALFRAGKLSWSKVRLLVRAADADNEKTLCHAALDASVSDVARLCRDYRWKDTDNNTGDNDRALKQWESRSLRWDETSNGSTRIQLILPPEMAQAVLNSVEHSLNQLDDSESTYTQRRADAAVFMAETSLQATGRDIAVADRYQVIVSVDASELGPMAVNQATEQATHNKSMPSRRPTVRGAGSIARETARRIACDCSITKNITSNREPTDIGRKSRIWPAAMARAIKERDQHCQFYGCTQTINLQIHHIVHWADGGSTCVSNGACVCQYHHTLLHEGGYTLQNAESNEQYQEEQFFQQQQTDDAGMFEFEKELRNNRESYDKVRRLLPTRYRFRIVDVDGQELRSKLSDYSLKQATHYPFNSYYSTRGECAEPAVSPYFQGRVCGSTPSHGFKRQY